MSEGAPTSLLFRVTVLLGHTCMTHRQTVLPNGQTACPNDVKVKRSL